MKVITKPEDAFSWLCRRAEEATSYRAANPMIDMVYEFAKDDLGTGEPMAPLNLEAWVYITEAMTGHPGYSVPSLIKTPIAIFLGDLLADLAYRGREGSVSVEQAVLMMICALEWCENFKVIQPTLVRCGSICSRRGFENKYGISMKIPIGVGHSDLHFSF